MSCCKCTGGASVVADAGRGGDGVSVWWDGSVLLVEFVAGSLGDGVGGGRT